MTIRLLYFIYIYIVLEPSYGSFLFNLYAECIMKNAGLDEAQAGIKISRRNINKHRYSDDTTRTQKAKRN